MTAAQWTVFGVLALTLGMFAWDRWRFDVVAVLALLALALAGHVTPEQVFSGFGHTAVITVGAVMIMSHGLSSSGAVDAMARLLTRVGDRPWLQVAALTGIVAVASAFMNNIGALALLMPVGIWMGRKSGLSPSVLLMPLAFGSLLGGLLTMIGTPTNIIIAQYRAMETGTPFRMFDFLAVGGGVAALGVLFIASVGWRLTPQRKKVEVSRDLFQIGAYLTEVVIPEGSRFDGGILRDLIQSVEEDVDAIVPALVRGDDRRRWPSMDQVLRAGDVLLIEVDSESLTRLLDRTGLKLAGDAGQASIDPGEEARDSGGSALAEVIVTPGSVLIGTTLSRLELRERHRVNVLAVARQGQRLRERLSRIRFAPGDILLVQGDDAHLQTSLNVLGCLPLASRGLRIGKPRRIVLAGSIFSITLGLIAFGIVPAATGMVGGAIAMVLSGLIAPTEIYKSIDLPVIVLLAALLPVGQALEVTGGSQLIADALLRVSVAAPTAITLGLLMAAVMLLSNVINNAAAAVLAAPVAIHLADSMNASADPFLMAVAVGACCAFLTPIGHQSNAMVMVPGGYRFGDYWRMGLPLSVLIVALAVPLILWRWPLG